MCWLSSYRAAGPVATRDRRTINKSRLPPSTEQYRSRRPANDGSAAGHAQLVSYDHLVGAVTKIRRDAIVERLRCRGRLQKARRSSRSMTSAGVPGAVLINTATLEAWQLLQMTTVVIACTTGVHALPLGRLSGCQGNGGGLRLARIECANAKYGHREEYGNDGKHLLAAFHGSGLSGKNHDWSDVVIAARLLVRRHDIEPEVLVEIDEIAHEFAEPCLVARELDLSGLDRVLEG